MSSVPKLCWIYFLATLRGFGDLSFLTRPLQGKHQVQTLDRQEISLSMVSNLRMVAGSQGADVLLINLQGQSIQSYQQDT